MALAAEGQERLRASAREAINTFERVIKSAKEWRRAYIEHANQIIEYINERVLEVGDLYGGFTGIAAEGAARFEGRVPPGFKDRHKKGTDDDFDSATKSGANRYGDLIFWRESLSHAKSVSARAIIVLTNDRKNDWRMGGENNANIDEAMLALRKAWRPVPLIHPMLALEAQTFGIKDVALLDSQYLAALLRDIDETRVASFADVAIVPDPPSERTEKERRKELLALRHSVNEAQAVVKVAAARGRADEEGYRFPDDPALTINRISLQKALYESRKEPDKRGETLLKRTRAGADDYARLSEILDGEAIAGMDQNLLARMARGLHDLVLENAPGYEEALADLGDLLPELPLGTASALTLGLLASTYLEPNTGDSRIPPRSPIKDLLEGTLNEQYGEMPGQVIAKRLSSNDKRPLYIPFEADISCHFETDSEAIESDALRSLKISDVECLLPAQEDPEFLLRRIVGGDKADGEVILEFAAGLFGIPKGKLNAAGDERSVYFIPDGMGFKNPRNVFRAKDEI